ncbi:predicted protein [Botrytis cinerea T4]|uniref:Uncharacterized protein n=1 Tax=Botryotinia fuckeliana (strain T4) TaxID=999810 RepID=G2Y5K7_BOTF4|nr:predicted protein [Botrytis cinerea T4]
MRLEPYLYQGQIDTLFENMLRSWGRNTLEAPSFTANDSVIEIEWQKDVEWRFSTEIAKLEVVVPFHRETNIIDSEGVFNA